MANSPLLGLFLCIVACTSIIQARPTTSSSTTDGPLQDPGPRRLLGSSFGVPMNKTFDYVIVGGGTAGLAVAARLAQNTDFQIAVIEAGNFYEVGNSNLSQIPVFGPVGTGKSLQDVNPLVDWGFHTVPQAGLLNQTTHYARGKCLGGSSGRNYLTYQRANQGAYQRWADLVGDQSYSWNSFLPFFQRTVAFTSPDARSRPANATPDYDIATIGNDGGPVSVTFPHYAQSFSSWAQASLRKLGVASIMGFTNGDILGSSYQLMALNADTMERESSETSYLRKLGLPQSNLVVYQSTMATRILFDENRNAIGVQVTTAGLSYVLSATREVIVSAGAFQSPQLLMVSGVGPASTLQRHGIPIVADRSGVGQNMEDHVLGGISYRVNLITTSSLKDPQYLAQATADYLDEAMGMLTDTGDDLIAFEKLPASLKASLTNSTQGDLASLPNDWPDIELLPTSAFYGYQNNAVLEAPNDGYNYATIAVGLAAPFSRGSVDIASSDMADPPIINPNWLTHPTDQAVAIAGIKRARQIFATLSPILIGPEYFPGTAAVQTDDQILNYIRQTFFTIFHASCTCAMGRTSDPNAVVDSQARVIGVNRLRVVDISAFPLLTPGHPVATIYALAEKIADAIINGN